MIELAKASTTIAAPVDTVFRYVSNMENYKHWFPGVVAITSKNNLAHGIVGKKYSETLSLPNGESELIIEVDQCEVNHIFITRGDLIGILPQMTVRFSVDEDNHCYLDLQYHSRNPELTERSEVITALQEDLITRAKAGLVRLKEIMELND